MPQSTLNPDQPPSHVFSDAVGARILLIKPVDMFDKPLNRRRGHSSEPRRVHLVRARSKPSLVPERIAARQESAEFSEKLQNSAREIRAARVSPVDKKSGSAAAATHVTVLQKDNVMQNHETNENNQVMELSKEEMRQILGGGATAYAVEEPISQLSEEVRCGICGRIVIFM